MNRLRRALLAAVLGASATASAAPKAPPVPDWRDQIVYFVMLDRFDDGDPRNDDQHAGEFGPTDGAHYSGGDLAGVTRRLDYIRGLGATAVWITPPVAHQWWNLRANYGGYHGYWADDFSRVDPHFGTLADYRALADGLHGRGMYLVQDVVVNHVADYFRYDVDPAADPSRGYMPVRDGRGRTAPPQPPFDLNDPRRARDRAASIYHWTPDIVDYGDPVQEKTWQLAGLDDLNTDNATVRRALRASYAKWIRDVGVDAFRVDTAFYVPPEYFEDFLYAEDSKAPGILRAAKANGKPAFHLFGEGFGLDRAFDGTQARKIETYVRGPNGEPRLPGMIDFPLYGTALDVFARGRPTAELADRIERRMRVHSAPHLMATFIDNHDVDRFRATGSDAALKQALLMLMTVPGIPVVYYGTEQGFTQQRAAMFAHGYASGGRDHFDATSDGYRYLQRAIALRRGNRVLSRGTPTLLASNPAAPGALVYRMDSAEGAVLVAFNTADRPTLLDALDAPVNGRLRPLFAIDGDAPAWDAHRPLVLPARAGYAWTIDATPSQADVASDAPTIDTLPAKLADVQSITGRANPGARLQLVLDGDLSTALPVSAGRDGRWRATLPTSDLVDPEVAHRLVAFNATRAIASAPATFHVDREWAPLADLTDPQGDDTGPTRRYTSPADAAWRAAHPGDITHVRAFGSGGALRLDIGLRTLMKSWNPANGFDHVALTVYVSLLDARDGVATLPLQDAVLPNGARWQRRLRIGGWSNTLTASDGADATHEGAPVTPGAQLRVDAATSTLQVLLPASALGRPSSLRGARVYVTTWDYDGGYRGLSPDGDSHTFGCAPTDAPKILDDAWLELR
ncbi:alpha-amylase family glycosyl hydrolase [Cognatilysobacter terrigena]|uniref:alpha-amylase family glycosyl hydrolase n=1 Tax=Cognatilysobacter terrigena TaxID=2488749 RepID=UPI0014151940|nr:alpha-amylase family glycosyl hydrolase [Lysobacter terrigena]